MFKMQSIRRKESDHDMAVWLIYPALVKVEDISARCKMLNRFMWLRNLDLEIIACQDLESQNYPVLHLRDRVEHLDSKTGMLIIHKLA